MISFARTRYPWRFGTISAGSAGSNHHAVEDSRTNFDRRQHDLRSAAFHYDKRTAGLTRSAMKWRSQSTAQTMSRAYGFVRGVSLVPVSASAELPGVVVAAVFDAPRQPR